MRSVTGQWGEASRDRFRLNTPIAAIGVKGTDFVVKVENGKTFASVLSGRDRHGPRSKAPAPVRSAPARAKARRT